MSELETKIDAEVEDFSEDLSDEALDRVEGAGARGAFCGMSGACH